MTSTDQPRLDGPRLAPLSGHADSLVVLLHGYGADGNDLIDLGRAWQQTLPNAAFVAPNAPEPCAGSPYGRQWFTLTLRDRDERWRGVEQARPILDRFLDAELARLGLAAGRLALVGFSQGAMTALHVGLRRAVPPAAIVALSGVLVASDDANPLAMKPGITGCPPVLLVHGNQDEVIPPAALAYSEGVLRGLGVPVEAHLRTGLGHAIDQDVLRLGGAFLQRCLAAKA